MNTPSPRPHARRAPGRLIRDWLPIRRRALGILAAGQWVSTVGNALNGLALGWLVLSVTDSRAALGLVSGLGDAAGLLMIVSGVWVDRWNRRRTMLAADVVRAAAALALGLLALAARASLAWIIGLVVVSRLAGTFFAPASFALLPEIVDREDLGAANGLLATARTSAGLLGQLLGGVLLGLLGPAALFLCNAGSFAASSASLAAIRPAGALTPPPASGGLSGIWRDLVAGQHVIWRDPFLKRLVPIAMATGFFSVAISVLDVAWVRQILHAGPVVYGGFWVAAGLGGLAGSALSGRLVKRFAVIPLNVASLVAIGLAVAALALTPVALFDLGCMVAMGFALGVQSTSINTALLLLVPEAAIGRSIGAIGALANASGPVGAVAAGLAATAWPLGRVLWLSGVMVALTSLGLLGIRTPPASAGAPA